MKHKKKIISVVAVGVVGLLALTGCDSNASVASENLSVASDNFEINRRVVFVNGITDKYLMSIEKDVEANQLEVTCKISDNDYKKHFLGISDNVTYLIEQLDSSDVSVYHHRIIMKPETIVPEIELQTGVQ